MWENVRFSGIQPDFLAVFAAEHGLHRLNET
jgi:hypothetical protein